MISVIIPFYKASNFILESVNSVIKQELVSEIIVVYDGCPDIPFSDLNNLFKAQNKVILVHHQEFKNFGPAASRNLGIQKASNNWISFLDADDYFLVNRFESFKFLLNSATDFEGVYQPIQYFNGSNKIYGIKKEIPSHKLFHYLIRGTYGHFHTNGLIIKKDLLFKAGLFNKSLTLHQDSELWLKLAFYGRLVSGDLSAPVSMVRIHGGNRIWKGTSNSSRLKQWKVTWQWAWNKPVGIINKLLILRKLLKYKIGSLRE
ncbi:glycosyltransferase family 2 protein [Algoriphagus marinus]|uniref:glycosyltransferase family 2 protein n=1 Tax=Algoriphagus marinus TaxID=1925762 RepID=UPI00094B9F74|nr:glycosyltransferase family 2 protein [Algoriphagus marinus]